MMGGWMIAALFALGGFVAVCTVWRTVRREETWLIAPRWEALPSPDRQDPNNNYSSVRAAMHAKAFVPGAIYRIPADADITLVTGWRDEEEYKEGSRNDE